MAVTANTNSAPYTFTIAVPDADAAYPTNTPPPPPGSLPPLPPDLPVDGSVELRGEVVSVTKEKAGYDTFVETTPPKRYLIRTQWDERSHADSGSDVTLLDQEGGVAGYSYLGNVPDMYVDVTSGILHTKPEETSIYNWGIYGDSTDSDSQQLFKENTTKMLEQLAAKDMPAFSNTLTTSATSVTYNLDSTETHLTSGKLQYRFESNSSDVVTVNWLMLFQPNASNPDQTIRYKFKTLTGSASDFQILYADLITQTYDNGTPSSKDGTLKPALYAFKLRDDANIFKGWDSTSYPNILCMPPSSTSENVKLVLADGISSLGLELVVKDSDQSLLSLENAEITASGANFKINSMATSTKAQGEIDLRTTSDHTVLLKLFVDVLPIRSVNVKIYRVHDSTSGNAGSSAVPAGPTDDQIMAKLNEVYGPQAQIQFNKTGSGILDIAYDTYPFGNGNGKLDWSSASSPYVDERSLLRQAARPHEESNFIAIYIVGDLHNANPDGGQGPGITNGPDCCIASNASIFDVAHETGHALGLSVVGTTSHDSGPKPIEFHNDGFIPAANQNVLMYSIDSNPTDWIREPDWNQANDTAPNYH